MELLDDPKVSIDKKMSIINELKSKKETKPIIAALKNYDWRVRVLAVNALNDLADEKTLNNLVDSLKDAYPFVRVRTVVALDNLGWKPSDDLETAYYLIAQKKWDEVAEMGEVAIEPLIETLLLFNETNSTKAIAKPLGKIGEHAIEQITNRLVEGIVRKKKTDLQSHCLSTALVYIGKNSVNPLTKALDNENKLVRLEVVQTLGQIGDEKAAKFLIPLLEDEDMDVRSAAQIVLNQIKPSVIPGKDRSIKKDSPEVKETKEDKVINLITALADPKGAVRRKAAIELGETRDPRAIKPLIGALQMAEKAFIADRDFDFNMNFMKIISAALGKMGKPAIVPLINALKTVSTSEALINIGPPATASLIRLLEHENEIIRQRASYALGEIKDPKAVDPLIQCLQDDQASVRRSTASALGEIGDPKAAEQLTQSLKDKDVDVRQFAAAALGEIGDTRAVEPLIQTLKDNLDETVQRTAAKALGEIGDKKAVEPLTQALDSKDIFVQKAAKESLDILRGDVNKIEDKHIDEGQIDEKNHLKGSDKDKLYNDHGTLIYEGEIKDGKAHGKGRDYYPNGTTVKFEGEFRESNVHGKGKLYWENGTLKYEGKWENSKMNGKGKLYYQNGTLKYQGKFKEGSFHGKGKYYYENGVLMHKGGFKNGKIHGYGKSYDENGDLLSACVWEDGDRVS